MDNLEKNRQHRKHKTKTNNVTTKYKTNNTECVLYHYAQANTNNVKQTGALLQTTGSKDELS